jgi:hypothetical protein
MYHLFIKKYIDKVNLETKYTVSKIKWVKSYGWKTPTTAQTGKASFSNDNAPLEYAVVGVFRPQ